MVNTKLITDNNLYSIDKWIPSENKIYLCKHGKASFMEPCIKCEDNIPCKINKWIPSENKIYLCKHSKASFMEPCVKCENYINK